MITVKATSTFFETQRKFKSEWGIKTYLLKLRRLHRSHLLHEKMKNTKLKISINHIN